MSGSDGVKPADGVFSSKLFSRLVADIRGNLDVLQSRVDTAAANLIEKPNQMTLDEYKDAISHLIAYLIDNSSQIEKTFSLKKGKDGARKHLVRVEIIDQKLDELTREVLKTQKPVLDLVNRLDEIRGILLDFYDWSDTT